MTSNERNEKTCLFETIGSLKARGGRVPTATTGSAIAGRNSERLWTAIRAL